MKAEAEKQRIDNARMTASLEAANAHVADLRSEVSWKRSQGDVIKIEKPSKIDNALRNFSNTHTSLSTRMFKWAKVRDNSAAEIIKRLMRTCKPT